MITPKSGWRILIYWKRKPWLGEEATCQKHKAILTKYVLALAFHRCLPRLIIFIMNASWNLPQKDTDGLTLCVPVRRQRFWHLKGSSLVFTNCYQFRWQK